MIQVFDVSVLDHTVVTLNHRWMFFSWRMSLSFASSLGYQMFPATDRRLPEQLVAGFRATLEEVVEVPFQRGIPSRDDFKLQQSWS